MQQNGRLREELLAEVEVIAPILAEHAPQSEKLGRLDDATVEALHKTRLPQFPCPRDLGGDEADPVTQMEVWEALARIDASTSWVVGIWGTSSMMAAAYLPTRAAKHIFANDVPRLSGMLTPRGQAEPVKGGYRVKGRWSFGSGIHNADWIISGAFVTGRPPLEGSRAVLLPRNQVAIHNNWQVAGLRASGSCDYSIEDVFVPDDMTFSIMDMLLGNAATGGASVRLGLPALVTAFHMAMPLGIARRALDEITAQAVEKARGFPPSSLATQAEFQFALGKAETQLAAARALARQVLSSLMEKARTGQTPPPEKQAETRAAAVCITELAQQVATMAFQAAGGGALFDTNPLQRCWRDAYAVGQHFAVSQSSYRALGQFRLKQPDANPML